MKYAWIENNKIRDVCQGGNPAECYVSTVPAYYDTLVPDEAQNGDSWINGQLTPKPVPEPLPTPPQTWSATGVRNGLTLTEKTRWDNNGTQEIITAKVEFQVSQGITYTTELLTHLVASNSISQTTMDKILAKSPADSNV